MKLIAYVFGSLTVIIALMLGVLFSSVGNSFVASQVQNILDEEKTDITLDKFVFGFSDLHILLTLGENATFSMDGKISFFKQEILSDFQVYIADMSSVKVLKENNLRGAMLVNGEVKGSSANLNVTANTKSLGGNADVEVTLIDMEPSSVNVQTTSLELQKILYLIGKKAYADARIDMNINAKEISRGVNALADINLNVSDGSVSSKIVKEDFGLDFKKEVAFNANITSSLGEGVLNSKVNIGGDIANIYSKSMVELTKKMAVDADYSVSIANLNSLYFLTSKVLNGGIVIEGTVKGDKERLVVNGKSDVFDSQNTYYVTLKDYKADSLEFSFIGMKIEQMLYMLNLPEYSTGLVDLDGSIKALSSKSRNGQINTNIHKASLKKAVLNKEVNLSMHSNLAYSANVKTTLNESNVDSALTINSDVVDLHVKKASFNIDSGVFKTDYLVKVSDLKNLYFVTKQNLKGNIDIDGDVTFKDELDVTAHSRTLGGSFDAHLLGNTLNANVKNAELLQLCEMLTYPQIFDSRVDAKVLYDLNTSDMNANFFLENGHFVPNQFTTLLRKVARIDLENEFYKNVVVDATMKDKIVKSKLDMTSQNSRVTVNDFVLNTINEKVAAKVGVKYKEREVYAKIGGKLNKPKIKLDMNKLMKSKGQKEVDKLLGDKIPEKLKEPLKNIFKLFWLKNSMKLKLSLNSSIFTIYILRLNGKFRGLKSTWKFDRIVLKKGLFTNGCKKT